MKTILHRTLYLPALLFWIPFVLSYRLANKITQEARFMHWAWLNISATDDDIYDHQDEWI